MQHHVTKKKEKCKRKYLQTDRNHEAFIRATPTILVNVYMYRLHINVDDDVMTEVISTRVPNEIARDLREIEKEEKADRATVIRKLLARAIEQWRIERALRLYRERKVTLWRAARLAGVTLREMMELAAKEGIQFQYSEKDLEEDIEAALKE